MGGRGQRARRGWATALPRSQYSKPLVHRPDPLAIHTIHDSEEKAREGNEESKREGEADRWEGRWNGGREGEGELGGEKREEGGVEEGGFEEGGVEEGGEAENVLRQVLQSVAAGERRAVRYVVQQSVRALFGCGMDAASHHMLCSLLNYTTTSL